MIFEIIVHFRDGMHETYNLADRHSPDITSLNIHCEPGFVVITDENKDIIMFPSDRILKISAKVCK